MSCTHVACIFARGGSKGIPRKNLRLLAGKPLLVHAIETAHSCSLIHRVIVSTDDPEIAEVAARHGAEVPFFRPAELAADDAPEWLAWKHAIVQLGLGNRPDEVFVCLPPTSPLRAVNDVETCIQELLNTDADIVLTVTPSRRNPYFNMVVLDRQGYATLVIPPVGEIAYRQAAPPVYDMTTVAYAARPAFVLSAESMWEGKVRSVVVPPERALDIDDEFDLEFAAFLIERRRRRSG